MIKEFKSKDDRKIEEIVKQHDAEAENYEAQLARLEMKVNNGGTLTEEEAGRFIDSMGEMLRLTVELNQAVAEKNGEEASVDPLGDALKEERKKKIRQIYG